MSRKKFSIEDAAKAAVHTKTYQAMLSGESAMCYSTRLAQRRENSQLYYETRAAYAEACGISIVAIIFWARLLFWFAKNWHDIWELIDILFMADAGMPLTEKQQGKLRAMGVQP